MPLKSVWEVLVWVFILAAIFGGAAWLFWAMNPELFGRHSACENPAYADTHPVACREF